MPWSTRNVVLDPPTRSEWDILEDSFWSCWRDRNATVFTYKAWIHIWRANLHPPGKMLELCLVLAPNLLFPHPARGRKTCQRSASLWIAAWVLWLSEPVHDLLTHHCSLSVARACRGATRKRPSLGCLWDGYTMGWASASAQGCYTCTAKNR